MVFLFNLFWSIASAKKTSSRFFATQVKDGEEFSCGGCIVNLLIPPVRQLNLKLSINLYLVTIDFSYLANVLCSKILLLFLVPIACDVSKLVFSPSLPSLEFLTKQAYPTPTKHHYHDWPAPRLSHKFLLQPPGK